MSETPPTTPLNERAVTVDRAYWLKQFRTLLIVLVAVYGALVLLLYSPLYKSLVLRPWGPSEDYARVRSVPGFQEYTIPNNHGNDLHTWLFKPNGAQTLVVIHHGNAGNVIHRMYLVNAVLDCGAAVLVYDYRGYGKSSGEPSLEGLVEDGLAVYDFARSKLRFDADHIVNFGESIGTGVACQVATMRPSAALILQSPIGSLPQVAHAGIAWLNVFPDCVFPTPQYNNVQQIKQVHVPLLILHGTADRIVPSEHSKLIFANANEPKRVIFFAGAGHNNMPAHTREYRDAVCQLLTKIKTRRPVSDAVSEPPRTN